MKMRKLICLIATIDLAYILSDGKQVKESITKVGQHFECPEHMAKELVTAKVAQDVTDGITDTGINMAGVYKQQLLQAELELATTKEYLEKLRLDHSDIVDENLEFRRKIQELKNDNDVLVSTKSQLEAKTAELETKDKRIQDLEKLLAEATAPAKGKKAGS